MVISKIIFLLLLTSIIVIFTYSLYLLISKRKRLILPNLLQPILFCLLYFQISVTFGDHHYQYDYPPSWYHWIQFTFVHILHAVDLLDILQEYQIDLQNIKQVSFLSGATIVAMHWIVDLLLISWIFQSLQKKRKPSKIREVVSRITAGCFWITFSFAFPSIYMLTAFSQHWSMLDFFFLWPLDNLVRALDMGDTMQIFDYKLHSIQMNPWISILAIYFRFSIYAIIARIIKRVLTVHFRGLGLTSEQLTEEKNRNVSSHSLGYSMIKVLKGLRTTLFIWTVSFIAVEFAMHSSSIIKFVGIGILTIIGLFVSGGLVAVTCASFSKELEEESEKRKTLVKILSDKFQIVPENIQYQIAYIGSVQSLDIFINKASLCDSLSEFQENLRENLQKELIETKQALIRAESCVNGRIDLVRRLELKAEIQQLNKRIQDLEIVLSGKNGS